jgi:hypothetical protein
MLNYFYYFSDLVLFFLLIIGFLIFSLVGVVLVKHFLHMHLRFRDNPVVGNISALIGIIYGVLAGLMALYLINNVSYTNDALLREANAVANIFRDSQWLNAATRSDIQKNIDQYIHKVLDIEWPLMEKGKDLNHEGTFIIDNMMDILIRYPRVNTTDELLVHDMLDEVKNLYNARQQRINMSNWQLNTGIWLVILVGTILTIGINYFYKMHRPLHMIAISAAALMAASMIFLLISLDRPFQGEFGVQPTAFLSLLDFIEKSHSLTPTQLRDVEH